MEKLLVTIGGVGLVGLIYFFFFGKGQEEGRGNKIKIIVDGGYRPGVVKVVKDKEVKIIFLRKDQNSCLEEVIFPDYKIKKYLPLNEPVEVVLAAPHKNSQFHCGMNMFFGKIKVI